MKPKTKLQKRVYEIHKNLPALTQHQKEWTLEHCFKHLCIFHKTTKEYICVDCGHRWKYDDLSGSLSTYEADFVAGMVFLHESATYGADFVAAPPDTKIPSKHKKPQQKHFYCGLFVVPPGIDVSL